MSKEANISSLEAFSHIALINTAVKRSSWECPRWLRFRQEDGTRKYISVWKARQAEIFGHGVVLRVLLASLALAVIAWICERTVGLSQYKGSSQWQRRSRMAIV